MAKGMPNLASMLNGLAAAGKKRKEIEVRAIRDVVGRRSFAPLLLTVSLMGFTPLGGIPGVPSTLALMVILIAAQMLIGRESLWLPKLLLDRKVQGRRLARAARSLQPAAKWVDRWLQPRLEFLTLKPSSYVIALVCIAIALTVPPLELVPFVDMPLWAALVAFSLALATHDGVLAIAAFLLTITGVVLTAMAVL